MRDRRSRHQSPLSLSEPTKHPRFFSGSGAGHCRQKAESAARLADAPTGEKMQAAEAVVRILEDEGIEAAFGIPGAAINPVYKYLRGSRIVHYIARHEEGAAHAADGYCRASGRMALAICTSGPAATNLVTGLYTAQADSIPLIAITGQAASNLFGMEPFQCVDIAAIARPVSKATWCVRDPGDVVQVMREAFRIARSGRPGPVLIDRRTEGIPQALECAEGQQQEGVSSGLNAENVDSALAGRRHLALWIGVNYRLC